MCLDLRKELSELIEHYIYVYTCMYLYTYMYTMDTYRRTNRESGLFDNADCPVLPNYLCAYVRKNNKKNPKQYYSTVQITLMHTHNTKI